MIYIPKRTKLLIIVLGIGVLIMFALFLALNTGNEAPKTPQLPSTGVPIVIPGSDIQNEPTFKNYLSLELNSSSEGLERLPDFLKKSDLSDGGAKYEFLSTYPGNNNIIISKNQKIAFKSNVTISSNNYQTPIVENYISTYGHPQVEFTGSARYGRFAKTYIYPDKGFSLIFNPTTKEVYEVQSFNPVSLDEYIRNWGFDLKDYSKETPKPEI